jgi:membrane protease YdiL (CAAX protease family)
MNHLLAIDLTWQPEDLNSFLPVTASLFAFIFYWFTTQSEKVKEWFYNKYDHDKAAVYHITFNRILGFLTLGLLPSLICMIFMKGYTLADFGLTINSKTRLFTIAWTVGLSLLVMPLAYISAKKPRNLVNYPQIRAKTWTWKTVWINAAGWALFLFGYEFMFRGVLLFPLAAYLGAWPAIAINISFYAATHIPKGLDEAIGAILLGLVLCILTLISGTIWIAFFVHVALAWTNCFTALKFHPEINFIKKIK